MPSQSYDERWGQFSTSARTPAPWIAVKPDSEFGADNSQWLSIFQGFLRRMKCKRQVNPSFSGRESR